VIILTAVIIEEYQRCQLDAKFYPVFPSQGLFHMETKLLGIISVGCDLVGNNDQVFFIRKILEKKWEYNATVRQLFVDFRNAYDSVRGEV
jgi:hypothetical protein